MKEFRFLLIGIGILLLSILISSPVAAQGGQTYGVGTSSLHVRSAPSQSATILGQVEPGDQVVVFKELYGWAQTYYGGQEAWIASQYLYPVEATQKSKQVTKKPDNDNVTVNSAGVRVRSGPGTNHSIIGFATTGDTYSQLETKNDWYKVMLHDGSTGWIASWLTDSSTGETTSTSSKDTRAKMQLSSDGTGSLVGYNIVLDPGHGGNDPGAIGFNDVAEKKLTLSTAETVASHLRDAGATVEITREDDHYVSLDDRVQFSSSFQTNAFISLHYNSYPFMAVNGIGTYYYTDGQDRVLAESIQNSIGQLVGLHDRGTHYGNYHVLRENSDLAVLIELGFISNPNDLFTIQTSAYQNNVAQAITDGLGNYFN